MRRSMKIAALGGVLLLLMAFTLYRKAETKESQTETSEGVSATSETSREEMKRYFQKKVAHGKLQLVIHKQWKTAYEDFEKAQTDYDAVAVRVASMRAEATKGLNHPEQWQQLPPEKLEKLAEANSIEQAAHERLVESIETIRKVKVL